MGRNCSDALNALVNRIVCAVGLRETLDTAFLLLAAALLPFVVLLEPAVFVPLPAVLPVWAALLLVADLFVCSVAVVEVCVRPPTLPQANDTASTIKAPAATPARNLLQILIMVSLFFQPTHPL
jgi:hypothetical protein